jgi:hypothetical protein
VFNGNRRGYSHHIEYRPGRIEVVAARRGKRWFAHGDGELLRFRARLAADGFPASLQVEEGKLVSSGYEKTPIRLLNNPASLALRVVLR